MLPGLNGLLSLEAGGLCEAQAKARITVPKPS